jgi:hypothetical protein
MITPHVTELPLRLEAVEPDPFIASTPAAPPPTAPPVTPGRAARTEGP